MTLNKNLLTKQRKSQEFNSSLSFSHFPCLTTSFTVPVTSFCFPLFYILLRTYFIGQNNMQTKELITHFSTHSAHGPRANNVI